MPHVFLGPSYSLPQIFLRSSSSTYLENSSSEEVSPSSEDLSNLERRKTLLAKDGVGELQEIGEFGLGVAPSLSRPINKIEISKQREEEIFKMQADDDEVRPQTIDPEDDPKRTKRLAIL